MERKKRLHRSDDIQRVRQKGKSFPHPRFVLIVSQFDAAADSKVGVVATKSVGGAVERNRSKRLLREAVMKIYPRFRQGWQLVIVARKKILDCDANEVALELEKACLKAGILN